MLKEAKEVVPEMAGFCSDRNEEDFRFYFSWGKKNTTLKFYFSFTPVLDSQILAYFLICKSYVMNSSHNFSMFSLFLHQMLI